MQTLQSQKIYHGNMGADPRIFTTKEGNKIARFSFATHSGVHFVNGKMRKETHWHDAMAFGQAAEFIENYGRRGIGVMVQGKEVERTYTNKKGEPVKMLVLQVSSVKGL